MKNQPPTIKRMEEELINEVLFMLGDAYPDGLSQSGMPYERALKETEKTAYKIVALFRSYLSEVLEYLRLEEDGEHISYSGAYSFSYNTKKEFRKNKEEWDMGIGYNQAVSELNDKIKKLKGE